MKLIGCLLLASAGPSSPSSPPGLEPSPPPPPRKESSRSMPSTTRRSEEVRRGANARRSGGTEEPRTPYSQHIHTYRPNIHTNTSILGLTRESSSSLAASLPSASTPVLTSSSKNSRNRAPTYSTYSTYIHYIHTVVHRNIQGSLLHSHKQPFPIPSFYLRLRRRT